MALWPLHQKYKLKKVIMSTYQAASNNHNHINTNHTNIHINNHSNTYNANDDDNTKDDGIKSNDTSNTNDHDTCQAASGAGAEGMKELEDGVRAFAKDGKVSPCVCMYVCIYIYICRERERDR